MSAADLPKITLDKDFQKRRQENYLKQIERERMEKEELQRENEEMKRQLSKLATAASSSPNLQVNLFQNSLCTLDDVTQ